MNSFKKVIVLCIAMILALSGCAGSTNVTKLFVASGDINKNAQIIEFDAVTEICSNVNYVMQYDPDEKKIDILNKTNGLQLWSTGVTQSEYGTEIKNKLTAKALKQIVNVKYTDFEKKSEVINNLSDKCSTVFRKLSNGLRMDFSFDRLGIKFAVEFTLSDSGVSFSLPKNSIKETGNYGITSIDILPMLGATLGGTNGYFLVPDGCGALYRFDGSPSSNSVLTLDVYDDMLKEFDNKDDDVSKGVQKVCAPVFGISHAEKGLFANITNGSENCSITLQTDQSVYAINRIYPVLNIRKQYFMTTASGDEVSNYEKKSYVGDLNIEYTILNSSDSGYSAMSKVYRDWLIKEKLLDKKSKTESFSAAIDFLVSVQKKSMITDTPLVTSSFKDISKVIKSLKKTGVEDIVSILYGWQKNGYYSYPGSSVVSSAAGGKSDLKDLVSQNKDTKFYLLQNYLKADINVGGFSKYSDVVYKINNIPLTDEAEELFLLNPATQFKRFEKDLKTCDESGLGLAFEGFGSMLYEDYETSSRMSRTSFKSEIQKYLNKTTDKSVSSAVDGFSPYTLKYADTIFNLPDKSSEYLQLNEAVPFLQMVIHGYVDYSAVTPGNLSNDLSHTTLKWVEYGYMPTFMLTCENSDRLEDSSFSLLFTSEFDIWGKKVSSIYSDLKKNLSQISSETMVSHEKTNGIAKITYSNGIKVIVNYNSQPITENGVTVMGNSYLVLK